MEVANHLSLKAEPTMPVKKTKTTKGDPEKPVLSPEEDVQHLRAQVEELASKLGAATINKLDIKPKVVSNPFSGADINLTPGTSMTIKPSLCTVDHPPKRPPTAFNLFCTAHRKEVLEVDPKLSQQEITVHVGDEWKNASEEARSNLRLNAHQAERGMKRKGKLMMHFL